MSWRRFCPRPRGAVFPAALQLIIALSARADWPVGGTPVQLEIFDLAGRRVSSPEVSGPGPGRRLVTVAAGRSLPVGVYAIRLSQDGRALSTRGAVIR